MPGAGKEGVDNMEIIDAYEQIAHYFPLQEFSIFNWEQYAGHISRTLVDLVKDDIKDYSFEKDILPVVKSAFANHEKQLTIHNNFQEITQNLSQRIQNTFGVQLEVDLILYLGLCNGAGWATELDGRPVVLLGMEKIIELAWDDKKDMIGLVYHELGHIWHRQVRNRETILENQRDKALWQLYSEGVAMFFEQMLCGDMDFYHQDTEGWLNWCIANRRSLFVEYYTRLVSNRSVRDFFGDWNAFQGKTDVGYYLGCELVKSFQEELSLKEIANLELSVVEERLKYLMK